MQSSEYNYEFYVCSTASFPYLTPPASSLFHLFFFLNGTLPLQKETLFPPVIRHIQTFIFGSAFERRNMYFPEQGSSHLTG